MSASMYRPLLVLGLLITTAGCGDDEQVATPPVAPPPPAPVAPPAPPEPALAPEDVALRDFIVEQHAALRAAFAGEHPLPGLSENSNSTPIMLIPVSKRSLLLQFSPNEQGSDTKHVSVQAMVSPDGTLRYEGVTTSFGPGAYYPPISEAAAAHAPAVVAAMERVRRAIVESDCDLPYATGMNSSATCADAKAAFEAGLHPASELMLNIEHADPSGHPSGSMRAIIQFRDDGLHYSEGNVEIFAQ